MGRKEGGGGGGDRPKVITRVKMAKERVKKGLANDEGGGDGDKRKEEGRQIDGRDIQSSCLEGEGKEM